MPINLNSLKEQIQTILQDANTTTAAHDLSSGLTERRVQRVLKINPNRIPVQTNWYPFVTVYVDSKDVELKDFAVDQLKAKRVGVVDMEIVAAVLNTSITDPEISQPDEYIEMLMENIEQVIRGNPTLNGIATWHFPDKVTYHNDNFGDDANISWGKLTLQTTVFY